MFVYTVMEIGRFSVFIINKYQFSRGSYRGGGGGSLGMSCPSSQMKNSLH